ncbi:hypothetical protein COY28_00165 [Candidatus Woesearchaeota archaeon CG_4_10_14_0_2_um_filter_57_5]|nr:MAG: hypothetical protein AUJ68_04880 [Candidatus Woesearchaeota archaeon CG1_02_57_44]PIN70349.1 MAG: hypothetical protein COV94_01780 [Candidatus Woesearchaeota archaeon CG11_big_fil_rev_8_21_14_0_20_57_5]PIZ57470.1 MAG: hypothetical protein COY28_00165 [Candidatus Woesearchaeota archaeon CG_4_10_14_0_2_um_filter_57_5]
MSVLPHERESILAYQHILLLPEEIVLSYRGELPYHLFSDTMDAMERYLLGECGGRLDVEERWEAGHGMRDEEIPPVIMTAPGYLLHAHYLEPGADGMSYLLLVQDEPLIEEQDLLTGLAGILIACRDGS